jgi:gamma-tubulin complex component 5
MLLTAPDSLVVTLAKYDTHNSEDSASTSKKGRALGFGVDALDVLNFAYKVCTKQEEGLSALLLHFYVFWCWQVSWPLDLIVNTEALKKYNQVMSYFSNVSIEQGTIYVMTLVILLNPRLWDSC